MALGQFQHALEELMSWLTHTEELLDAQRPISGDPKVIEVELAKHHVSIFISSSLTLLRPDNCHQKQSNVVYTLENQVR